MSAEELYQEVRVLICNELSRFTYAVDETTAIDAAARVAARLITATELPGGAR